MRDCARRLGLLPQPVLVPPGGHTAEFDSWEWKPMRDLPDLIVPFKRMVYDQVVAAFAHLDGVKA